MLQIKHRMPILSHDLTDPIVLHHHHIKIFQWDVDNYSDVLMLVPETFDCYVEEMAVVVVDLGAERCYFVEVEVAYLYAEVRPSLVDHQDTMA